MPLPTFSKTGVPTFTFSRGDAFPRRTPADPLEGQLAGVSEAKTVRIATMSDPEEFMQLDFQTNTALPAADYLNLRTFLTHALINRRANPFTFTDVDGTTYTVRYWGGLPGFDETSSGRYQGTLTLRVEVA
jgi:hypothetical protein